MNSFKGSAILIQHKNNKLNQKTKEESFEKYRNLFDDYNFQHELFEIITPVYQKYIKTNLTLFDEIIGGGISRGYLTEIIGPPGIGKTQFCHQILSSFHISHISKISSKMAIFIDSENSFRISRLQQIIDNTTDINRSSKIKNILFGQMFSQEKFMNFLNILPNILDADKNIIILIIDSIAGIFWNVGEKFERTKLIVKCGQMLVKIARKFNIAIIVTNRVNKMDLYGKQSSSLGNYWSHFSSMKLEMRKNEQSRILSILKSFNGANGSLDYDITSSGLEFFQ